MQTAILIFSSVGCVAACGALAVSLKTALELQKAKKNIDHEVNVVKTKVAHNAKVVKRALGEIQT